MFTLLIADDEVTERELIRFLLKDFQETFKIIEASNGKEALSIILKESIDILLSDIQMPFLNGIELATKAKATFPDIEVLFFSGYDDFSYVQNALSLKAVNYILKPVNPVEFYNSITDIIKRLNSRVIQFTKSERYIESSFHDEDIPQTESDTTITDGSLEEDSLLLQKINLAISMKQSEELVTVVHRLLNKYKSAKNLSHIYVRYICTSILEALFSSFTNSSKAEFEEAAKRIYSFQHFCDISELIELYLNKAISQINQALEGTNYAVNLVKQYINDYYEQDLTLVVLADMVYLSPNYLSNIFTKTTGKSINKYIRQVRIQRAKELLINTNMKIWDISIRVGYPNPSYFCKIFQAQVGTTPEKFRNPLNERETNYE